MGLVGFADLAVERLKVKSVSFKQVNTIVDWRPISNIINKQYVKSTNARYRGLVKTHTQHLTEVFAYNLYRWSGILISGREK